MNQSKQISFEKIQQKITACMKEAHQELHQVAQTGKSYERLYETFKEIEIFIYLFAIYIEMEPGIVENETNIETIK